MYSTCLFCHASLGSNESIEHFPVGRRLAFDAAKGRLWVVCRSCERWNLTPLEERWEAIDECERLFSDAKLRVSTENVGLARLREGTTLIRIGAPKRPELAAWRYGDQFDRRRRKYIVLGGVGAVAAGGIIVAGPIMGIVGGSSAAMLLNAFYLMTVSRTVQRMAFDDGQVRLTSQSIQRVEFRPNAQYGFELEVPGEVTWDSAELQRRGIQRNVPEQRRLTFTGDEALDAARILLAKINASGGSAKVVSDAVNLLEPNPDPGRMFTRVAREVRPNAPWWSLKVDRSDDPSTRLAVLPAAQRLALEMALHENDERRALEGELSMLEARWKEAEEIAAISDDLLPQGRLRERLRSMKERL